MQKNIFLSVLISVFLFSNFTNASTLDLSKSKASVEFLAIGRPSALKIHGKSDEHTEKPLKGKLSLAGKDLTGTVTFHLDLLDTGIELRTKHMKEKYLQTKKFPEAELTFTKFPLPSNLSGKEIPFQGILSLHGIKKPVTGTANLEKKGNSLTMETEFKLKSSDFGVETAVFMGITMSDEVTVNSQSTGELTP